MDVNRDVRLVYIFGCDSGKRAPLWQEHLAPARVVAYNRWSTVFDHALWFALTGPAELKELYQKYPNAMCPVRRATETRTAPQGWADFV